jgi:hypothetical protein
LRPAVAKRRVANIDDIGARRNNPVFPGFSIGPAWGAMCERTLARSIRNWRMDQCAIHMDAARTMLHRFWQTSCPFLPQPNVIQCTDRRVAAT